MMRNVELRACTQTSVGQRQFATNDKASMQSFNLFMLITPLKPTSRGIFKTPHHLSEAFIKGVKHQ